MAAADATPLRIIAMLCHHAIGCDFKPQMPLLIIDKTRRLRLACGMLSIKRLITGLMQQAMLAIIAALNHLTGGRFQAHAIAPFVV